MELQSKKRKRRRGMRLNDAAVAKLPFKREPYAIWDLTVENCGVRVSRASKACVVSVRVGMKKKFVTVGTVGPDGAYEYLRELAIKEIARLKRERLPKVRTAAGPTLRQSLEAYITANPELRERTIKDYRKRIESGLEAQMDQSVAR